MIRRRGYEFNTQNTLVSLLGMVLAFIVLIWVVKGLFSLLSIVAPILLIITLFINHRIVLNYGKWLLNLLKNNVLVGVAVTLLSVVGFPVVSLLLFSRAILQRKVKNLEQEMRARQERAYSDYEILEEIEPDEHLELPRRERASSTKDEYDHLFD